VAAAEASGDALGAGLIEAIREQVPDATFVGLAGPKMIAAGCEAWWHSEEISVMGLAEVLKHLPRLLKLRRRFIERVAASGADVFVGIDAPDFNLPSAKVLRARGIPTVQYVSPQIWAWRQSRVATVRESVDLVLCVLPFETAFYESHGVNASFIGHPLADQIPLEVDTAAARAGLGLAAGKRVLAVLPGSRRNEVATLAAPFMATAAMLQREVPDLEVVVALASERLGAVLEAATRGIAYARPPRVVVGRAREVLSAADAVLVASGTATLETMLLKKPMVVAYRIVPLTYWLVRKLGVRKLPYFSLPNLLAGRQVVQEFVQAQVRPEVLAPAMRALLETPAERGGWYDRFSAIHRQMRCGASGAAALKVLELVRRSGSGA
jgi:lipid-A-disaccharide synthase